MAVSKLWSVTSRLGQVIDYAANPEKTATDIYTEEQYQALRDVLSYAKDEEKTEREFFVEGINCNPATARDQFVSVKKAYGKDDGIQAYHGYLSFKEQDISPELAQKIGMEFANEVWGKRFQVVVTTHLNTKHLHCHYVINSVSFVDGKRLWGDEKAWFKFRLVADRLCEKYGLYYNPNQVVVARESGIDSLEDLIGKHISVGAAGSTTVDEASVHLSLMGKTLDDLKAEYMGTSESADAISNKQLDGVWVMAGTPNAAVTQIMTTTDAKILPIPAETVEALKENYPW